jgi:hypothetical protein
MALRFKVFIWLILLMAGLPASADSKRFVETSIGVGFHQIKIGDNRPVKTTSEYLSLSLGYQLKYTLAIMGSFKFWNTERMGSDEDNNEYAFNDFNFTGLSTGIDAQLFLPFLTQGPYIKAGHHCWTAYVRNTINIFNHTGCSKLVGLGMLLKTGSNHSVFTEVLITRFKKVESWMLVIGGRF